jgi:hypothetical protein
MNYRDTAAGNSSPNTGHILGTPAIADDFIECYYQVFSIYSDALTYPDSKYLTNPYRCLYLIPGASAQRDKYNYQEY